MSIVFSDTTNYRGLVQLYERECGFSRGEISGNTAKLKEFTADVNNALDDFTAIAINSSGTWQWDDSNQTDYPIVSANLVLGQRDYPFTTDGSGNLMLDIYRVFVADSSGKFTEIFPRDVQSEGDTTGYTNGQNTRGTPTSYDKTANGIFLDAIPSYNSTGGLKVYINREASYFTSADTSKKPGVPGVLHKYFYLKPASDYARRNVLTNADSLAGQVLAMEGNNRAGVVGSIEEYFSKRTKDEKPRLVAGYQNNK